MTAYHDTEYLTVLGELVHSDNVVEKDDRTGTGTYSLFSRQMRFDISDGTIPLLTSKKMFVRGVIYELLWYLRGDTNVKYLNDHNVHIWDDWTNENGDLGPVYGKQWRRWPVFKQVGYTLTDQVYAIKEEIDQIGQVVDQLRNNPDSRRHLVSAWNVAELQDMNLPPCHYSFQFWVGDGKLSCMLNQRSADFALGVPFNIVQYSILTHMLAHVTGYQPGEFIWNGGDVHLYKNHVDGAKEQLTRDPYPSPTLHFDGQDKQITELEHFEYEDFRIEGYQYHPKISLPVSV